jgi:hypothetical protein
MITYKIIYLTIPLPTPKCHRKSPTHYLSFNTHPIPLIPHLSLSLSLPLSSRDLFPFLLFLFLGRQNPIPFLLFSSGDTRRNPHFPLPIRSPRALPAGSSLLSPIIILSISLWPTPHSPAVTRKSRAPLPCSHSGPTRFTRRLSPSWLLALSVEALLGRR